MRLFAGLPLPPSAIDRLSAARLRLAGPKDGLRWSSPEQWHITLRFCGDVSGDQAQRLEEEFRKIERMPVPMRMDSFGVFATKGILFADVFCTEELQALHVAIEKCVLPCGIPAESRPFRPHITLARSKNRTGDASLRRLSSPSLPAFGPEIRWIAEEIWLYESELLPDGAAYRTLARIPLKQATERESHPLLMT